MVAPSDSKPEAAGGEPAGPAKGGGKPWLPVLLSVVLAPAASFAVAEFVLLPRLQSKLQASLATGDAAGEGAAAVSAPAAGHASPSGSGGKPGTAPSDYEFSNVIVNVAGTLGTRYLKTSFVVTGVKGAATRSIFETQKGRMTDVALNVLSSLTLADLEEPGSRNVVREKLVTSFNQTLGRKVVEQVYFSDFVIQ